MRNPKEGTGRGAKGDKDWETKGRETKSDERGKKGQCYAVHVEVLGMETKRNS